MDIRNESPIILRRHLRGTLRALREERGLSQKEVATALTWRPLSKLLHIESGMVELSIMDLCVLLHYYGIDDPARTEELIECATYARQRLYAEYEDVHRPDFRTYLQYEGAASVIRSFEPSVIPGLLQTEEYAECLLRALSNDEARVRRLVHARMKRQEVLDRADGFKAIFILDEAVLHHQIGGPIGLVRQLEKLRTVSDRDNVDIRVIPNRRGAHLGLWGTFVILEFAAPADDDLVFLEHQAGDVMIADGASRVAPFVERFWGLEASSLSVEASRDLIDKAAVLHHAELP
ncbi:MULTISPECIES: Scr1 family TA system antitoxin-like transcriptional regulator [Catenuloplanes]|nr:Scr1 family TA system antitoxin-like transcriptional regulator [Catenuloplanes niger]